MLAKKLIYLFVLLFSFTQTFSSHIVGGDFSYQRLQGDQYILRLRIYRDAFGLPQFNREPLAIGIYDKETNLLMDTIFMRSTKTDTVKFNEADCVDNTKIITETKVYEKVITLGAEKYNNLSGYYISWERAARNVVIVNIDDPGNTPMAFYMEIPSPYPPLLPAFVNSSPRFIKDPLNFLCVNKPFTYNFKVEELDGDSLVYTLVTPLAGNTNTPPDFNNNALNTWVRPGPYPEIDWATGYSLSNIMNGIPDLAVNSKTGDLSVTPKFSGFFVFAVKVSEYRKGIKIGEVRREIQFFVYQCEEPEPPNIVAFLPPGGNIATLVRGKPNCIDFEINDNSGDILTYKIESLGFDIFKNGASIIEDPSSTKNNIKGQICWTPPCDFNISSIPALKIFAYDDSCPDSLSAEVNFSLEFVDYDNQEAIFVLPIDSVFEYFSDQIITFPVGAIDLNNDSLYLSAESELFNLINEQKPTFENVSGVGAVNSLFTWRVDCDNVRNEPYIIKFILKDRFCNNEKIIYYDVKVKFKGGAEADTLNMVNIFTPNGDSKNDTFILSPEFKTCLDDFQIIIFNRWGEIMFTSLDQDFAWDGGNAAEGVYFYVLKAKNKNLSGAITLLR